MRFVISATLAACLCSPVIAAPTRHALPKPIIAKVHGPDGPPCLMASAAEANAMMRGSVLARLNGDDAKDLLDRINRMEPVTDYHADSVIVLLFPDHAAVALFSPCHVQDAMIRLEPFEAVWIATRGVRV